ncbi:hypothetical protein BKA80DRAFT_268534 [Phyllosticta citrichinensis]
MSVHATVGLGHGHRRRQSLGETCPVRVILEPGAGRRAARLALLLVEVRFRPCNFSLELRPHAAAIAAACGACCRADAACPRRSRVDGSIVSAFASPTAWDIDPFRAAASVQMGEMAPWIVRGLGPKVSNACVWSPARVDRPLVELIPRAETGP